MSDARLSKQTVNTRKPKAALNREVTHDRVLTDAERLEEFRKANFADALPNLPKIPGYHVCWLTTTNNKDTVQSRERMGYEPVRPEEVRGFEYAVGKGGLVDGLIHVNEMVAYKINSRLYEAYMQEAHHHAPAREEEKLTDTAQQTQEQLKKLGSRAAIGDGVEALRELESIQVPAFES